MAKNGLHLITPTSITYSGGTSAITANGSVTMSASDSVSINGVFSADYDAYQIVFRHQGNGGYEYPYFRLRSSGSDNSTTNYSTQQISISGSSYSAYRLSGQTFWNLSYNSGSYTSGSHIFVYGPHMSSEYTVMRELELRDYAGIGTADETCLFADITLFDGFTIYKYPSGNSLNARIAVYGMRK